MLLVTAVISIGTGLYMSNRTVVSSQTVAVGFFGPGPLDYNAAHDSLLLEIDTSKYLPIDKPEWAGNRAGGLHSNTFSRSDWFEINENGVKNYVNISSSNMGFAVDVWVYKLRMNHETVYREGLLRNEVVSYYSGWWKNWFAENNPG